MKTIDLGTMRPDYSIMTDAPAPEGASAESETPKKKVYPSLYISDLDTKLDLPDSGEAIVKFKVVERRETERDGKKTCSYDIEIHELTPTAKKSSQKSSDDDIEEGLSEAENSSKDEDY
jgi:hypothetical protein